MKRIIDKYGARINQLGLGCFLRYLFYKKIRIVFGEGFYLRTRNVNHSLFCRKGTTDIDVFKHVFVLGEYTNIRENSSAELVVDCGANAGFSTVYLLNHFPQATVIAIEPDSGNFDVLLKNTCSYGKRCRQVQAAVWKEPGHLVLTAAPCGDGREWARGVRPAAAGEEAEIKAISISQLLEEYPKKRVALLKIDIEGSEEDLFTAEDLAWLDWVDRIVIELHSDACKRAYHAAVSRAGFESFEQGGLTFSQRPTCREYKL